MTALRVRAHAKVNLTLEVLGRRADGYHEVRGVFARISAPVDEVRVSRSRRWWLRVRPPLDGAGGEELGTRAARALLERVGQAGAFAIDIRKRIPLESGLGGGSSDAAAVLRALGRLLRLDHAPLAEVATALGSDVPFFLDGSIAEVRGKGEEVRPLQGGPWPGVLVLPRCRIATADAFASLDAAAWSDGSRTAALATALARGGVTAGELRGACGNAFDAVAVARCPDIVEARRLAEVPLFLSGSGPALFAVCDDRARALALLRRLRRHGWRVLAIDIGVPTEPLSRR